MVSHVGRAVELPSYADEWMAGARFGEIRKVTDDVALIMLTPPLRFSSEEGPGRIRRSVRYPLADVKFLFPLKN